MNEGPAPVTGSKHHTRLAGMAVIALAAALSVGCTSPAGEVSATKPTRTAVPSATAGSTAGAASYETQVDTQGAVVFEVTPIILDASAETLQFDVVMNTHSVDVGWDLAALATLRTDTGLEVGGLSWPVGGGHHYSGVLVFPALTSDGAPLLAAATTLTLTIVDTDVPQRSFFWTINGQADSSRQSG